MSMEREDRILAALIKSTHCKLREKVLENPSNEDNIWRDHVNSIESTEYAEAMQQLSDKFWLNQTRLKWLSEKLNLYFLRNDKHRFFQRLDRKIGLDLHAAATEENEANVVDKVKILDVGSCHNPLSKCLENESSFDITAIDLSPATKDVKKCDFLSVSITHDPIGVVYDENELKIIAKESFEAVIFCLLLEYIPSPSLRLKAVEKAVEILKPAGLLLIVTPDSNPANKNQPQMKSWRLALAHLGLVRIYIEKLKHVHCLAFVKVPKPKYEKVLEQEIDTVKRKYNSSFHLQSAFYIPQDKDNVSF